MNRNIFFFEKTPFMAVELLDLLKSNFKLISYFNDDNYKNLVDKKYSIETYGNTELTTSIDSDKAVVAMLKNDEFIRKLIKDNNNLALFFYMSQEMDDLLKSINISTALPDYEVQEKIGNKLFLTEMCNRLNIEVNKSIVVEKNKPIDEIYRDCLIFFGKPFIVQGGLGVSGEDTFKVNSFKNFKHCFPKLGNIFKASKFIKNNIPVSVHICITREKIFYEGPFVQIIGFDELSKNKFQFSGNDTNQKIFTNKIKGKIFDLSMKLSNYVKSEKYLGILGIDFLWDIDTDDVYVQEINSRLVGLTRLLTGIQKEQHILPHLIRHINEFTEIDIPSNYSKNKITLKKYDYSQIYISHNNDGEFVINKYLLPGIYRTEKNTLVRSKDSLYISDMDKDEVLITYSAFKDMRLHADQIISKFILKKSVLNDGKYEMSQYLLDLISIIKKEVIR